MQSLNSEHTWDPFLCRERDCPLFGGYYLEFRLEVCLLECPLSEGSTVFSNERIHFDSNFQSPEWSAITYFFFSCVELNLTTMIFLKTSTLIQSGGCQGSSTLLSMLLHIWFFLMSFYQ